MPDEKIKVVFIAGMSRCGSTVLSDLLGQLSGFVNAGEIHHLWKRGLVENRWCGCGQEFKSCPFWSTILDRTRTMSATPPVDQMIDLMEEFTRRRHLWRLRRPEARQRELDYRQDAAEALQNLYKSLVAESGAKFIVDSSKEPGYGLLLRSLAGFDVRVVHLVRDARATAHSIWKKKIQPDTGVVMGGRRVTASALRWILVNAAIEALLGRPSSYIRVGYEEFVTSPIEVVEMILELLGESPELARHLPIEDNRMKLAPSHSVSGNPVRFTKGCRILRLDRSWRSEMNWLRRTVVTLLTWPAQLRYHD